MSILQLLGGDTSETCPMAVMVRSVRIASLAGNPHIVGVLSVRLRSAAWAAGVENEAIERAPRERGRVRVSAREAWRAVSLPRMNFVLRRIAVDSG